MTRALHLALAAVLALALVASAAPAAGASTTVIGTDGELASETAGVEFRETGNTSVEYVAPEVTVTATQHAEDCGVDRSGVKGFFGFFSDTRNDYLCLQYNESVTRTFEVYVSETVWAGYEREAVTPRKGDAEASFEGADIDGERYLKVTVTLDEAGTYAYPVNRESTFLAERVDNHQDRVENVTGVGVAADNEWKRVNPEDYSNESTYVIQSPNGTDGLHIEYETKNGWEVVPESKQAYSPVYYETVSETEVLVFAAGTEEPPALRYTKNRTSGTFFDSFLREARDVPNRVSELFGGLFG